MPRSLRSSLPFLSFRATIRGSHALIFCAALCAMHANPLLAATLPTTTVLVASPASVAAQKPVTLTATVMASGTAATPGQVVFCVATATFCEDLNILGTAQVTSNGTATIKVLLGLGRHDIYAKFKGTTSFAASSSLPAVQTVEVTGHLPSVDTVSTSGSPGNYTLASTVGAFGTIPPTGTVSFLDATTLAAIASAPLDRNTLGFSFTPAAPYGSGALPYAIAAGDFNNDGIPDLAIANYEDSTVSVLLADPEHPGQFLPPQAYAVGSFPSAVSVGDFNGDGLLDIVVVNLGQCCDPSTVSVLLGDAAHAGKFLPQQTYLTGVGPNNVAVGDFNNDGLPDLAVGNYEDNSISLLFGDPTHPGQFLPQQVLASPLGPGEFDPLSVTTADFNGDGVLDLVVGTDTNVNIAILLGDPAHPGQFLAPVNYAPGDSLPTGLAVGDFNGDGLPDLAVDYLLADPVVTIMLADPAHPGQFLPPTAYPIVPGVGTNNGTVAVGDFNGDGILDLAVSLTAGFMDIFAGDPANPGKFLPAVDYPTDFPYSAAIADFNGDGLSDIATIEGGNPTFGSDDLTPKTSILLGTVTETATAPHLNPVSPTFALADYPGDDNYSATYSCAIDFPAPSRPAFPVIAAVKVSNVTQTSATISWDSNVPTYGQVDYGTTAAFGSTTPWPFRVSPKHLFVLTNLAPGTKYDFAVSSAAYFSGCQHWTTTSPTASFTTTAAN